MNLSKVGKRESIPAALCTRYFASVSFQFDITSVEAIEPVIGLVPPTQSSFLSGISGHVEGYRIPLLSDFSAHDITPMHNIILRAVTE
jgi:hypothetical protein